MSAVTDVLNSASSVLSSIISSSSDVPSSSAAPTSAPASTSSAPPPTSSEAPPTSSSPAAPSTTPTPPSTSTIVASSAPPETQIVTSVITQSSPGADSTAPPQTTVVVVTQTAPSTTQPTSSASRSSSSATPSATLNNGGSSKSSSGGGLSTAGTTAIAVVIPVVVVAALVLAGIFFWRRRKQKKAAEELRRNEVEDYGFNPNNDPTLPAVASEHGLEMTEDSGGYRGWGVAGAADGGSNGYPRTGNSPNGGISEAHSGDGLMQNQRDTMSSDDLAALGAAPVAGGNAAQVHRGPSNASSTYSAAGRTDASDEGPGGMPQSYEAYNPNTGFGYGQHGPYGDGTYGGTGQEGGMPIVRDVSARRNTRIQQPGNYQQGNSGIAQNF
ncbi:Ca2+-modulated nonselective cation channel polycystin [Zymoseptoria tritici IPO323]|uniref:Ca2+-modulated nonselective cation channel polycystin n=1 Tax=Zymoseptoria tritici (strain CBS 115943 / IPO323) TaxID=336722 RepID=F9XNS9_ZYMTI|nr:Ca2+-modulated nonselective cation channel polycystin [Zymoseptoria tritici IPO323]EGP83117.1 Ca2+-modulated nonselective cation channel polycystin [Zymoseptoria tritici IPO323]